MTLHGDKQRFWGRGGQQNFQLCPFLVKMDGGRLGYIFVYQNQRLVKFTKYVEEVIFFI